ncbi:MAG TPA: GNAT family N-acetyltransferase [Kofleriaceae bacterium]
MRSIVDPTNTAVDTGRVILETERLVLREVVDGDAEGLFRLDSDPRVHEYLGKNPVARIEQSVAIVARIREQYRRYGIARWATIEKRSGDFIGWSGLRRVPETINGHADFIDVGYRFIPAYWGKGYATESSLAAVRYAFDVMQEPVVYGHADRENVASRRVLEKAGLRHAGTFIYEMKPTEWYELRRT